MSIYKFVINQALRIESGGLSSCKCDKKRCKDKNGLHGNRPVNGGTFCFKCDFLARQPAAGKSQYLRMQ